ncbi:DUF3231 family protein [Metabacillus malikii]|uniref:DUF3231 family protein n=1 Tax=Metabacillus malikii TaxID=1504265 RepID=A0ABT9ZIS4_9BACI|nr:DUF3231 family protein [Metabacillus malikii]MDQ0231726.1 hypothetical protein [Metabacillus malikii]
MDHQHIKLTASELSYLWNIYQAETMSVQVIHYFLQHIQDEDIKTLLNHSLSSSKKHVTFIKELFIDEQIEVPIAFNSSDVNLQAKRLFSDVFYLKYIKHMATGGLQSYGRVLPNVFRNDIRTFFENCLNAARDLDRMSTDMLLKKGIPIRSPHIPYPEKEEFVKKQSFFLEGLGRRDALTGSEVTNLFFNIQTNQIGTTLATAFSQVSSTKKIQQYFLRGKDIAIKHIKVFTDYLENNSLPIPMSSDQEVTESTESPFSEKLMLYHFSMMIYSGIGNYGAGISESMRSDLAVDFSRLTAEILKYAEDGVNILINNEWLEQPPLAADRKGLVEG